MKKRIGNPRVRSVQFTVPGLQSRGNPLPAAHPPLPATQSFLKNRATYSRGACLLVLLLIMGITQAQNVAINADGSKPNPNAMLDINSASKGLLIPRITTEARQKIPNTQGLLVYDVNTNSFWYNTGKEWQNMNAAAALATTDAWLLTGNAGTVDNVNFIGTTDNVPFNVRVNNQRSGRIDPFLDNTIWGYRAAWQLTGKNNTAIGSNAMFTTTTGIDNTAVGSFAMLNNSTGFSNSAFGRLALQNNTSGAYNTAIGQAALSNNKTGEQNVAVGVGAHFSGFSGNYNTGIGTNAQFFSEGDQNTAVGAYCQIYAFRLGNTAMGYQASTASPTVIGLTSSYNTAIGHSATTAEGSNSTALGHEATTRGDNSTAIGAGALADVPNKVRIGNSAVTVIEGQVPFTTPSDGRFKFAIQEDVKGLDFILQLRPVTYQFDVRRFDAELGNTNTAGYDEAARMRRTGFIAQEVEQAAIKSGFDFSGIVKPKSDKEHYSLSYDSFVVPLVKAMQEQQQLIEKQDKKIADLQAQLDELKNLLRSRSH